MAESSHPMGLPFQAWVPKKVDVSKWCQAVFVGVFFTPNITLVYRRSSQSTGCCVFRRFGYLSYRQATPRKVKYNHNERFCTYCIIQGDKDTWQHGMADF